MAEKEERMQYFEFIQNVITRLNSNSFMIKGWSITIASALLALSASTGNNNILFIVCMPVIVFWILDTIYLQNERKFRSLFNEAVKKDSNIGLYEINTNKDFINNDSKNSFFNVFKSNTIISFHLSLFILTIACILFLDVKKTESVSYPQINIILKDTINVREIDKAKDVHVIIDSRKNETTVCLKKK